MRYKFLLILTVLLTGKLFGEEMLFNINYLGIPVVRVTMIDAKGADKGRITVKAKSTGFTNTMTESLDNLYISEYQEDYLTQSYNKNINQSKYKEKSSTSYDQKLFNAKYVNSLKNTLQEYKINDRTRDFFSCLYYLRTRTAETNGVFNLDANKVQWQAKYKLLKKESIRTVLGKTKVLKYKIDFTNLQKKKKENSDMLTNNLVSEYHSLYFWFTDDEKRIPVKAEYDMSPFSVYWNLTEYQP